MRGPLTSGVGVAAWRPGIRRMAMLGAAFVAMFVVVGLHTGLARAAGTHAAAAASPPQALILGDTVSPGEAPDGSGDSLEQYEAIQDGFQTTVVDGATWDSMTAAQFAQYQVVIIGDPTCGPADGVGTFGAAVANETTWEPVVMGSGGNKVIIGTDPTYHWYYGSGPNADVLEANGIAYAGSVKGATGAYVDLSCTYTDSEDGTPVPLLDGLSTYGAGQFTVGGAPCEGSIAVIAATGPTEGLSDDDLSNWSCSVHEFFDTFPADYTPLALATDPSVPVTYTGTDVSTGGAVSGSPYILISGGGVSIASNLSLNPPTQNVAAGSSATATVVGTLVSEEDDSPVSGASVTFDVTSGPDAGETFTGTTDDSGDVTFTDTNDGTAGTDQVLATYISPDGVTSQGTASITWTASSVTTSLSGTDASGAPVTGTNITVKTGTDVTDSATLSGVTSTAGGTVTYSVYSDSDCTTAAAPSSTVDVTDGTVPDSTAVALAKRGTYYWVASYSGDSDNSASDSGCGSEVENVGLNADIVVTLDAPSSAPAGAAFDATVNVANDGPQNATAIPVGLLVPPSLTIDSTGGATKIGQLLGWWIASLDSGDSTSFTVDLTPKATAKGTGWLLFAGLSLTTFDPDYSNNFGGEKVTFGSAPSGARVARLSHARVTSTALLARLRAEGLLFRAGSRSSRAG
jgi:hypothetical protein